MQQERLPPSQGSRISNLTGRCRPPPVDSSNYRRAGPRKAGRLFDHLLLPGGTLWYQSAQRGFDGQRQRQFLYGLVFAYLHTRHDYQRYQLEGAPPSMALAANHQLGKTANGTRTPSNDQAVLGNIENEPHFRSLT